MQATADISLSRGRQSRVVALPFALSLLLFGLLSALLISWKPIQLSIATVFLFAGPHNWVEFRYFLGRMPVRWGRSKPFFIVGLGGVVALTAAYAMIYALGQTWYLSETAWVMSTGLWNTFVVIWLSTLVHLRAKQIGRDRSWVFAIGFAVCALVWFAPVWFSLAMVYVHPLIALCFLDRQIKRTRPRWSGAYRLCLAVLPAIVVVMWTQLASTSNLSENDGLAWRITQHAGAGILVGVSSHLLVATHVFLETIHYGVWLVLIPLLTPGGTFFGVRRIPLAVSKNGWPGTVRTALVMSAFAVIALWIGFSANYTTTRDVYFTIAMAHVLAEAPFLIRLL